MLTCKFNLQKGPYGKLFNPFQGRYPELKWSVPETIDRAYVNQLQEDVIDHFFFNLYGELNERNVKTLLKR